MPTAAEIRTDLFALAICHLRAADQAIAEGNTASAERHLHNFYVIAEQRHA